MWPSCLSSWANGKTLPTAKLLGRYFGIESSLTRGNHLHEHAPLKADRTLNRDNNRHYHAQPTRAATEDQCKTGSKTCAPGHVDT